MYYDDLDKSKMIDGWKRTTHNDPHYGFYNPVYLLEMIICPACHAPWFQQLRDGEMLHRFHPLTVRVEKSHRGIPA